MNWWFKKRREGMILIAALTIPFAAAQARVSARTKTTHRPSPVAPRGSFSFSPADSTPCVVSQMIAAGSKSKPVAGVTFPSENGSASAHESAAAGNGPAARVNATGPTEKSKRLPDCTDPYNWNNNDAWECAICGFLVAEMAYDLWQATVWNQNVVDFEQEWADCLVYADANDLNPDEFCVSERNAFEDAEATEDNYENDYYLAFYLGIPLCWFVF